jgi:PAS domain S-box-containing protein
MLRTVFDHAPDAIVIFDDERVLEANAAVRDVLGVAPEELVGRRLEELIPPAELARLRAEGTLRAERLLLALDGTQRWVELTATADVAPGRHLAFARDGSDRRRAAQQAAIAELGLLALGRPALERLCAAAVEQVARTLGLEYAAVFRRGGRRLVLRAGHGWRTDAAGRASLGTAPDSQAGRTLSTGEPAVLGEAPEPRLPALLRRHGVVAGITLPIRGRDGAWGVLGAYSRSPRRFGPVDLDFLTAVANTLALAVTHAADDAELRRRNAEIVRLARQRERGVAETLAAEDRTRRRISQELHDDLLQSLLVIRQDLAELLAGRDPPSLLERTHAAVQQAIAGLRAAVFDLHPVVLEQAGLQAAVSAVVAHHAGLGGFATSVDVAAEAGGEAGRLALSVVRELVANAARHSSARHVRVRLWREGDRLALQVADDGRGMDPEAARHAVAEGHIGLASIVQRVEALGGRVELESRPGHGATVHVEIPLATARQAGSGHL